MQFGINMHSKLFFRQEIVRTRWECTFVIFEKFTSTYLFQIQRENAIWSLVSSMTCSVIWTFCSQSKLFALFGLIDTPFVNRHAKNGTYIYYYLQNREVQILKHFSESRQLLGFLAHVPNMEVDKAGYSGAKLLLLKAVICLNSVINYW